MTKPDIWTQWREHYSELGIDPKEICPDGIVDSAIYAEAKKKVLFVLKDANDFKGDDLCKFLRVGPKYQMWHTLARWAAGIQLGFPPYEEIDSYAIFQRYLHSVAAVNLKKTSGGASAYISSA